MITFLLVNHAHPGVVLAITAVGDIGIAVAQFHEGGVWRRAYALVVSLICTLGSVASFLIGKRIGNLRCHQSLASGEHS